MYMIASNAILTTPMHNKSETEHLCAFNLLHTYLVNRGFAPQHQRLDNKASAGFKSNLRQKGIDFQLLPPHSHRCTIPVVESQASPVMTDMGINVVDWVLLWIGSKYE
jgi:hypothetical protein